MCRSHFNHAELAFRWRISPRTLERWRCSKTGPIFLKIGGRVIYRLEDIEAFEKASIRHILSFRNARARTVRIIFDQLSDPPARHCLAAC